MAVFWQLCIIYYYKIVEFQKKADNRTMSEKNFSEQLIAAIDKKTDWFNSRELQNVLEQYRLMHTCEKTLYEFLLKKSLITPDPYKNDKKISDIVPPENSPFTDNERSMIIGMRLSDYDSTLDFLCNYYKFSVSNLQISNIKKLIDLNNAIQWNSFSVNSTNINTRTIATMLFNAKQGADALTVNMINDSVSKAGKAVLAINKSLKALTEFQREVYKGNIRKNVMSHPSFSAEKAASSPDDEKVQIKKLFQATMGKTPYYNELIDEIIDEDHSPDKANLQKALLKKLEVENSSAQDSEEKIDTKSILLVALRVFGAMPGQISQAKEKIIENHEVLESEHNTFFEKLKKALRKAFNIEEKPVFYQISITDQATDTVRHEKIDYQQFIRDLELRSRRYASAGIRKAPLYEKISQQSEEKILEYVNQQILECNKMLKILNGLDEFFKSAPLPQNRSKIKGLKMEITALKNSIVKANQRRSEYTAYIEEEAQLRKLGITNA